MRNSHFACPVSGILLTYPIPNFNQSSEHTTVTWFLYDNTTPSHLLAKDGMLQKNIYQDAMPEHYIDYLHLLANHHFSELGKKIICGTQKPFTHAVFDTRIPSYFEKNMLLMGDAATLLRPHISSGAGKALHEALSFYERLKNTDNIYDLISSWAKKAHAFADHLFGLSRAFGNYLVARQPDWGKMTDAQLKKDWELLCKGYDWYQYR